jgi:hypothetical protein
MSPSFFVAGALVLCICSQHLLSKSWRRLSFLQALFEWFCVWIPALVWLCFLIVWDMQIRIAFAFVLSKALVIMRLHCRQSCLSIGPGAVPWVGLPFNSSLACLDGIWLKTN